MRRLVPIALMAFLAACPTYERYGYVSSDHGLVEADEFAKYGHDQAMAVAIGREFGHAFAGFTAADYARQADSAMAYAKKFKEVESITADTLGHRLVVTFKSGWTTQVTPIADGRTGAETMATYEEEKGAEGAESAFDSTALVNATPDPKLIPAGKEAFARLCISCHGADGGGVIGPNLTDDSWLHGGTFPAIAMTIAMGVPDKGMPTWHNSMSVDEIKAVASYVWSIRGTTPATPKAAQGTRVPR